MRACVVRQAWHTGHGVIERLADAARREQTGQSITGHGDEMREHGEGDEAQDHRECNGEFERASFLQVESS